MRSGKAIFLGFLLFVLFFAGITFAAQDRYVRLRSVEGDVTIYPADSQRPNEATINTPLLDGDEIQTGDGRAELSFSNGITVRIADYSGVRLESTYTPMRINLEQGTVFVDSHLIERFRDELELRAGDAQVYVVDEGNIRVDLGTEGSVRVTTIEGQAEVQANGRRVLLNSGERTYIDPGQSPEEPEAFYAQNDELDEWNESGMDNYGRSDNGGYGDDYVDEDLYYDTNDLSSYGDWRNSGTYGNVWVPHVDYGWRPYNDGRWTYCNNSWFWVSYEPWGWAPYHYGRWGWGYDLGWYWIPGNTFGPAWVSWYSYGDYVGWCPLNYYNNPIYYNNYNNYYVPSIQKQKTLGIADSWTFVKKNDLGIRNIKQAILSQSQVRNIKIDKTQLAMSPKKDLVSYVIPKTRQFPSLVNDKRLLKQPQDIKNPIGIKNKEEQFQRRPIRDPRSEIVNKYPQSKDQIRGHNSTTLPKPKSDWNRNDSRDKPVTKPQINKPSEKQKPVNRDLQFKRNESTKQHYSPFLNPYYKGRSNDTNETHLPQNPHSREYDPRTREYDSRTRQYDPRDRDYDPRARNQSYERLEDVNPKYRDEAKKYFERFDHKNRPEVESPSSSPRPSSRSYEPPTREYKAPEVRKPESRRQDNNNNSSRSRQNSNSSSNKPDKPHN